MKFPLAILLTTGLLSVLSSSAKADVVTTFDVVKDTYVQRGNGGNDNFGSSGSFIVKDSGAGTTTRHGYLQFNLGTLNEVTAASFDLVVASNNQGGGPQVSTFIVDVFGLNDGINEGWIEGPNETDVTAGATPPQKIVWNNAPANNTANNGLIGAQTTFLGGFNINMVTDDDQVGNTFSISGTNLVNFLNADTDGLVTLIVRRNGDNGGNNLTFFSREGNLANSADLVVTTVPEPSSMLLLLLGTAGGGYYFKRRKASTK